MIRFFDFSFSALGLMLGLPIFCLLLFFGWLQTKSPLFYQYRLGKDKRLFKLVKYRTMLKDTAHVATHLAAESSVTPFGRFLRRTKLDELPQLWNVLIGDMSLVGPRPCLESQHELIEARNKLNVFSVRPGITGLAQVNDIDMSTPELLAKTDAKMIESFSVKQYFYLIFLTLTGKGAGDRIRK